MVLERDRYRCQVKGPGCDGHGVEADHILSVSEGGDNSLENLRAICVPCHRSRTGRQGAIAKQRADQRRRKP
jgi:5-methylcytosine-specific restriction protein A